VPVLIGVCVVLLLGLIALGVFLLLNNRDTPPTNPPATTPAGQTSAAPSSPATTAATSAAPTSAAPTPVAIPIVEGLDYDTAAARLVAAGFVPNRVDENSTVPAGRVIGTNPPAGNMVLPGTKIDVRVSKGLPQPTTTAPTTSAPTSPASAGP
jgi:cytoskeletal protein RodZ